MLHKFLLIFTPALLISFGAVGKGSQSADQILKKVQKSNSAPFETSTLEMKIQARDGSSKERKLVIKKKMGDKKKVMVKIQSPNDLKGVGLLTVSETGDDENQWLFLPSEKRSRRITSSNKGGKFLDSDLTYEDLSIETYKNFVNKVTKTYKNKKGVDVAVIVSKAKNKKSTSYGTIKTWVNLKTNQILRSEYYSHKKKLVKKMDFKGYKKFGSVWRARALRVSDVKKKSTTTLLLKDLSLNEIGDGELTLSALESN